MHKHELLTMTLQSFDTAHIFRTYTCRKAWLLTWHVAARRHPRGGRQFGKH